MKRFGFGLLAAAAIAAVAMPANAACNATINGQPMPPQICALATQVYGSVRPGHYWLDAQGNWGTVGYPYPEGNLLRDAQYARNGGGGGGGGGSAWTYHGPGGNAGSDGSCSYYNDPSTGASVMTGNC